MERCPYYTGFRKERLDCSLVLLVRDRLQSFTIQYFFRLLDLLTSHSAPLPPPPPTGKFDTHETLLGPCSVVFRKQKAPSGIIQLPLKQQQQKTILVII